MSPNPHPFTPTRRTILKAGSALGLGAVVAPLTLSQLTPAEQALAAPGGTQKLNVLFIGAHPDDEAGTLPALGQWKEFHDARAGVITITRGEGGGNAVGLEEGPPLGLMREAEERLAVGYAGIEHVFNLDGVDFYYTASAPLSRDVWGGDAVLNRIVRVIRATRPEVIVTMNPSAVEGNHGNHQQAAMYAVEAYLAAGDENRFPEHRAEGFAPWQPSRILRSGANGTGATGPDAVEQGYTPTVPSEVVFGTWKGTPSEAAGERWSAIGDRAIWAYVTQGWASRAPSPEDPEKISSNWFTLIHSRTPLTDPTSGDEAALRGAYLPIPDGLPLGTLIDPRPQRFAVVPGEPLEVDVTLRAPEDTALDAGTVVVQAPSGWQSSDEVAVPALKKGQSHNATLTVTPPADAEPEDVRLDVVYTVGESSGATIAQVRVSGAVEATIRPLAEIQEFRDWTAEVEMEHLDALVPELMAIGVGRTREVEIVVTNHSSAAASGQVTIDVPEGFTVEPATIDYPTVEAGEQTVVTVQLSQTDPAMPPANQAPNEGRWPVTITTSAPSGSATRTVTLNVVPTTTVPRIGVEDPTVDAQWSEEKYPGDELDISALWDGQATTADDVSGSAWISHDDDNLFVFVRVVDDIRGTILPADDNKRQRRTDSIEIYVDPRGDAPNTAHTFIAGIMPSMDSMTGAPGVGRDRDNWQGEADETAPGMDVAVVMASTEEEYAGYDVEAKIPFDVLPDHIDPDHLGFNVVINDSDTQDKAAQTRTGWSTYPGMRADPWRWGLCTVPGLSDQQSSPKEPKLPDTAARSVESPQSILQSSADGVPLGGWPALRRPVKVRAARLVGDQVRARVVTTTGGTVRAFVWDGEKILGSTTLDSGNGAREVAIPVAGGASEAKDWTVAVSLENDDHVSSATVQVR